MPIRGKNKRFGETIKSDDGNIYIALNGKMPFHAVGEILAHELAHVVTLDDLDHGEQWETAFEKIYAEFIRLAEQEADSE